MQRGATQVIKSWTPSSVNTARRTRPELEPRVDPTPVGLLPISMRGLFRLIRDISLSTLRTASWIIANDLPVKGLFQSSVRSDSASL
jgi:hypothetical protein